jgi:hypothetical protein
MKLTITKGPRKAPVRAVIYAIAGFGKTSTAAGIPGALFIDVEGSSERYDVARIEAKTHVEILAALKDVARDALALQAKGFFTIIVDTADWVQAAIEDAMCRAQNKPSIAECSGGFGKGYVEAGRKFSEILGLCDTLVFNGFHVVFLAHSAVKKVSPPGELQTYDRFVLAMDEKNFATPLYEWAEMVLFGRFEADVVEIKEGKKIKATDAAQRRVLHTSDATAWFAKNRFSLPREIAVPTVEIGTDGAIPPAILPPELAAVFAGKIQARAVVKEPEITPEITPEIAAAAVVAAANSEPAPPATADQIAKITLYLANSIGAKVITAALDHYNALDASELTEEQAAKVIARCQEEMNKPATPTKPAAPAVGVGVGFPWRTQPEVAAWLEANAAAVEAYAVGKKWITAGQSWREIGAENCERIISKADAFAKAAGIPVMGGAK